MKQAIIVGGGAKARCFPFALCEGAWKQEHHVEVWCINFQKKQWLPRIDRMFNIHRHQLLKDYGWPCWSDGDWSLEHPHTQVYLADKWPDNRMHNALIFPAGELRTGYPNGDYHCNSLDWLLLYALHEKFDVVHLHGWNLEREGIIEQQSAAKCAEYWAGFIIGRGVEVRVGEDSSIFGVYHMVKSNRVYGYDDCPAWEDRTKKGDGPPYRYDDY